MSKAMGLLPSWYWPEDVQRYLSAPQVPLYELAVGRWARRYGDSPALVSASTSITFRELDQVAGKVAAACADKIPDPRPRLALAVRSAQEFPLLLMGLLRTNGCVLLLDPQSPREEQAAALDLFRPSALVTDANTDLAQAAGVSLLSAETLLETDLEPRPAARGDPRSPAIALVADAGIAYHSSASALSAAMAFAAFSLLETGDRMVVARPSSSWESVIGLLAPLQAGGAAVLAVSSPVDELAEAVSSSEAVLLWIDEPTAVGLLDGGRSLTEAARQRCRGVYLSIQRSFPRRLRRQLQRLLRVPVLTAYGHAAAGAIAASHPSWYLDEAVGIPMTGVDWVPVNPETRQAVETPWDLLTYAGIGVRSRAVAAETAAANGATSLIEEDLFYTGDIGSVDTNGMLYFLS